MTQSVIEKEFEEIDSKNGWHSLYQEIKKKCDREAKEKSYSLNASGKNQNQRLNRYRDVNPYDHSRIIIHRGKVDYINANLVKLERAGRQYILTQGPLRETVGHFWLMIWEQKTKAIVMLNKLLEKKQVKCHMYWPERIGPEHKLQLDDVGLLVEYINCEEYANYSKRTFKLTDLESNQSREVIQFHYTTWPDFSIPSSPVAFLHFLKRIRESGALDPDVGPAVIHCSAGIGRSGTFCLVDCCLVIVEKEGESNVSVQEILLELRRYRMGLIQTSDQLYFSYQAIIEGIKWLNDPEFRDYEEISIESKVCEEDIPPPLPPRIQSLNIGTTKPLPAIPNSESVLDDLITTFNDIEADTNHEIVGMDRPLPALPKEDSLEEEFESDLENELEDESKGNIYQKNEINESSQSAATGLISENGNNNDKFDEPFAKSLQNGIEIARNERSDEIELKRRKRTERQLGLEKKVNDIKRKQLEIDENLKTSKKRRSLMKYIMAGVVVGTICVYAYSKFG